jgi:hypothetical protein
MLGTSLLVSGCLDPVHRRRPAHADTHTYMLDEDDDRAQRAQPTEEPDEDSADADADAAAAAMNETETPKEPEKPATQNPTGTVPYAIKVPGKPGFLTSPYAEGKMVDARGLPPGMEIECPYTKRPILVP